MKWIYSLKVIGGTFIFLAVITVTLSFLSYMIIRFIKGEPGKGTTIANSVIFINFGNLGLPLILLVFPDDQKALSIQVIIIIVQTLLVFTLGIITSMLENSMERK